MLKASHDWTSRYIWNPYQKLSDEVRNLYNTLSAQLKDVLPASENGKQLNTLRTEILETFHQLHALVRDSGLEITKNFENVVDTANTGDVDKLIELLKSVNKPVKAGKSKVEKEKTEEWNTHFMPSAAKVQFAYHKIYCAAGISLLSSVR